MAITGRFIRNNRGRSGRNRDKKDGDCTLFDYAIFWLGLFAVFFLISEVPCWAVDDFPSSGSMFGNVSTESGPPRFVKRPINQAPDDEIHRRSIYNILMFSFRTWDIVDPKFHFIVSRRAGEERHPISERFAGLTSISHVCLDDVPTVNRGWERIPSGGGAGGKTPSWDSARRINIEGREPPDILIVNLHYRAVGVVDRLDEQKCRRSEPRPISIDKILVADSVGDETSDEYGKRYKRVEPYTNGGPFGPTVLTTLESLPFFAIGLLVLDKSMQYGGNSARLGQLIFSWVMGATGFFVLMFGPR